MPAVRATDDEVLATELWGENKYWDGKRQQFVPGKEEPSPGNSSSTSETEQSKSTNNAGESDQSPAPTMHTSSSKTGTAGSTAPSTGGSGTAKK